ncbi:MULTISPECIES: hypothetical protein [Rhizobium]|uniref:hypothetical protein n=1 Tax=Rhizobium TaxID=379 RepID=UPI00026ECBBF|nr:MULTISPECIES: hypothetical protein [Rhizobium]EJK87322.1 hypothetical protein PMI03_01333 [Rhizobium sp. AP16]MDJ1632185.1 hypothetical protein [Rhizobium rhizogenes]NTG73558.1 hypothetical protein [Rhizobium rhizogenes]
MPGWIKRLLRGPSSKAKLVELPSDARANLAAHSQVNLQPKSIMEVPVALPVWFNFPAHHSKPATYDGVFWEIEPWGEYLYYLAGAFQKNEKGLLRFGTAPLEIRAERNFETDAIRARLQDGDRAHMEVRSSEPWKGMTVYDACDLLLPEAQASGNENWIGAFESVPSDVREGRSRLIFGLHSQTGEPFVEVIYERYYPISADCREPFLFEVKTQCRLPDVAVDDVVKLHEEVAVKYRDVPPTRVSGAIKM